MLNIVPERRFLTKTDVVIVCLDVTKQPLGHSQSTSSKVPKTCVPQLGATTRSASRIPRPVKSSRRVRNGLSYDRPATPSSASEPVDQMSPTSLGLASRSSRESASSSRASATEPARRSPGEPARESQESTPRPIVTPNEHGETLSFPALLARQRLPLTIQSI